MPILIPSTKSNNPTVNLPCLITTTAAVTDEICATRVLPTFISCEADREFASYFVILHFAPAVRSYILGPNWQSQILKSIPIIDETAPNNASTNESKIPPAQQERKQLGLTHP
jgi:hypothetical protein